jgi:hypothetical protein
MGFSAPGEYWRSSSVIGLRRGPAVSVSPTLLGRFDEVIE